MRATRDVSDYWLQAIDTTNHHRLLLKNTHHKKPIEIVNHSQLSEPLQSHRINPIDKTIKGLSLSNKETERIIPNQFLP